MHIHTSHPELFGTITPPYPSKSRFRKLLTASQILSTSIDMVIQKNAYVDVNPVIVTSDARAHIYITNKKIKEILLDQRRARSHHFGSVLYEDASGSIYDILQQIREGKIGKHITRAHVKNLHGLISIVRQNF